MDVILISAGGSGTDGGFNVNGVGGKAGKKEKQDSISIPTTQMDLNRTVNGKYTLTWDQGSSTVFVNGKDTGDTGVANGETGPTGADGITHGNGGGGGGGCSVAGTGEYDDNGDEITVTTYFNGGTSGGPGASDGGTGAGGEGKGGAGGPSYYYIRFYQRPLTL